MACIKEIIHLGWILRKRSLRLSAVYKFWRVIPKSTQLIKICSMVKKELQGIHTTAILEPCHFGLQHSTLHSSKG